MEHEPYLELRGPQVVAQLTPSCLVQLVRGLGLYHELPIDHQVESLCAQLAPLYMTDTQYSRTTRCPRSRSSLSGAST